MIDRFGMPYMNKWYYLEIIFFPFILLALI